MAQKITHFEKKNITFVINLSTIYAVTLATSEAFEIF